MQDDYQWSSCLLSLISPQIRYTHLGLYQRILYAFAGHPLHGT